MGIFRQVDPTVRFDSLQLEEPNGRIRFHIHALPLSVDLMGRRALLEEEVVSILVIELVPLLSCRIESHGINPALRGLEGFIAPERDREFAAVHHLVPVSYFNQRKSPRLE